MPRLEVLDGEREARERLPLINAAGILVVRKTPGVARFLLARRLDRLEYNRFSPPGGKLEAGETPILCAARELKEEAGIIATPQDLFLIYRGRQEFTKTGVAFSYFGYLLFWEERMGQPQSKEPERQGDWEWASGFEIRNLRECDQLSAAAEELWYAYQDWEVDQIQAAMARERGVPKFRLLHPPFRRSDVIVPRLIEGFLAPY